MACERSFLRRLFELEVPEIHDGLISIRAVARIPGERAKIAVELRRPHRSRRRLRGCERLAYPRHRARTAQRKHRCYKLYRQHGALYTACAFAGSYFHNPSG